METSKKGTSSSKKNNSSHSTESRSGKKSSKHRRKKHKKRSAEKDCHHNVKGSSSPHSADAEDLMPSPTSDLESDSASLKVTSSTNVTTANVKYQNASKLSFTQLPDYSGKNVLQLQSLGTKMKKSQSSQSTRIKDSSSQFTSKSSKLSNSSSNTSIGSLNNTLRPSFSQSLSSKSVAESEAVFKKPPNVNESLRWDYKFDDPEKEEERIKQYKLNRRKRYLAAANKKYSEWVKTLSGSTHSLTSINSDHGNTNNSITVTSSSVNLNNSNHESLVLKCSPSSGSNAYLKNLASSSGKVSEGLVPGLATNIPIHRAVGQVMLNC